jgi:ABC-type multidrug transport system fused ATPase/permease subunit
MKDMQVHEVGTYDELMAANGDFAKLMTEFGGVKEEGSEDENVPEEKRKRKMSKEMLKESTQPGKALMTVEERALGAVAWSVYRFYFAACGGAFFIVALLSGVTIQQAGKIFTDLWLTIWMNSVSNSKGLISWMNGFGLSTDTYQMIYILATIGQGFLSLIFGLVLAIGGIKSAKNVHDKALLRVFKAPMSFFDTTPLGRIINRFSKDQDSVDNNIVDALRMFLTTLATCVASLALIVLFVWEFSIVAVILMAFYYMVQLYYRATSRELKRLDAISKSPLFAHFQETLSGMSTVRAYREEERFMKRNRDLIDVNNRPQFLQLTIQRWLSLRLENIGNLIVLAVGIFCILNKNLSGAAAALILSNSLGITGTLTWCVRQVRNVHVA